MRVAKSQITPLVLADHFGTKRLSSNVGSLCTTDVVESLAVPPLVGRALDIYQTYDSPILVGAASGIAGAFIVKLTGRPKAGFYVAD